VKGGIFVNCNQAKDLFSLYIDDRLTGIDKVNFEMHLKECPDCLEEIRFLTEMISSCNKFEEVELPRDFQASLREKLIKEAERINKTSPKAEEKVSIFKPRRLYSSRGWKLASGLAAVLLLVMITLSGLNDGMMNLSLSKDKARDGADVASEGYNKATKDSAGAPYGSDDFSQDSPEKFGYSYNSAEGDTEGVVSKAVLKLEVENYDAAVKDLMLKVNQFKGTVQNFKESDSQNNSPEQSGVLKQGFYSIIIPQSGFEDFVVYVQSLGNLTDKRIEGSDISNNYNELDISIKSLGLQEQRISEQIQKTKSAEDVILLERELSRIKTEMEKNKAALQAIDRLKYSSLIQMQITQNSQDGAANIPPDDGLWKRTKGGFLVTTKGIISFFEGIIVLLGTWLPVLIIILLLSPLIIKLIRKEKKESTNK